VIGKGKKTKAWKMGSDCHFGNHVALKGVPFFPKLLGGCSGAKGGGRKQAKSKDCYAFENTILEKRGRRVNLADGKSDCNIVALLRNTSNRKGSLGARGVRGTLSRFWRSNRQGVKESPFK